MKIVVCSDLHGQDGYLECLLAEYPTADGFVFLGDGYRDFVSAFQRPTQFHLAVVGNCDWVTDAEKVLVQNFDGVRTLMTHGHLHGVKSSTRELLSFAKQNDCKLALYGHTHVPKCEKRLGVTLVCPGALKNGEYAVITIGKTVKVELKKI